MFKVIDDNKLNYYIKKYNINDIFSNDMKKYMEIHHFKKNEHICSAGEELRYLYFFIDGRAKVYITAPNGKSLLIRFYSPIQIIGDTEILNNTNIDCNIQAVEDCICIAILREVIEEIALKDPKFLYYTCKQLAFKLSSASLSSSINMLYPLENRLASYILATYATEYSHDSNSDNLTHVSELLGTSYRHLLRVLDKFSSEGMIRKDGKDITILDLEKLEELAGDLYQ